MGYEDGCYDKLSAFLLQAGRSQNKKKSFSLIRLHLQKKQILEMFITAST